MNDRVTAKLISDTLTPKALDNCGITYIIENTL